MHDCAPLIHQITDLKVELTEAMAQARSINAEREQWIIRACEAESEAEIQRASYRATQDELVAALEREVFLAGFYKAFALGSGPCSLCDECNLESCVHPERARPAMEAAGIDVFATARGNGFPIEVVRTPSSPQNYYGLVLIE